jgi:stearoyl-CoA desaturase (delta-9 desaturase)
MEMRLSSEVHAPGSRHGVLRGSPEARQRFVSFSVVFGLMLVGGAYSVFWLAQNPVTWVEISCFAVFWILCSIGQGIGLHRYFSHRSFETSRAFRGILAFLATISVQGSIVEWVADHRRHHAHTDKCGDVHSPVIDNHCGGLRGLRGLWHAHLGWGFVDTSTDVSRYGRDMLRDPVVVFFSRTRMFWYVASVVLLPGLYGLAVGGPDRVVGCIVVAGLLRTALFVHSVLALNSIGHSVGSERFPQDNRSKNNVALAVLLLGEGWHNNHHRHPTSASTRVAWYEIDVLGTIITVLEKAGVVWDVVRVSRGSVRAHSVPAPKG